MLVYNKFGLGTQALGLLFLLYIITGTLAQKIIFRGSIENKKLGVALSCYLLCFVSCLLLAKTNDPFLFFILCIIFSVGIYLLSHLIISNIAFYSLNSNKTGIVMGISDGAKALAAILASIFSGFFYQNYSETVVFSISETLLLFSLFFYISYLKPHFLFRKIYDK